MLVPKKKGYIWEPIQINRLVRQMAILLRTLAPALRDLMLERIGIPKRVKRSWTNPRLTSTFRTPCMLVIFPTISFCNSKYVSEILGKRVQHENKTMVDFSFPCQTKETLKKFLPSMISKLGKLRSLARDLKKNCSGSATNEFPGLKLNFTRCFLYGFYFSWYRNCLSESFRPILVLELPCHHT